MNRRPPAYIQNFVEKAAPKLGIQIEGDVTDSARFAPLGEQGSWLRNLSPRYPNGLPEYLTVRRDAVISGVDSSRICFLRPGDIIFDALCEEAGRKFHGDVERGVVFCDPAQIDRTALRFIFANSANQISGLDRVQRQAGLIAACSVFVGMRLGSFQKAHQITFSPFNLHRDLCSGKPGACW